MLVVGAKEVEANLVSVRSRSEENLGQMTIDEFIARVCEEIKSKKR